MIKPEQIKRLEITRGFLVGDTVNDALDTIITDESYRYNGIDHVVRIPYNQKGFSVISNATLEELDYNIEPIIKEYLEKFIKQEGIYDGSFYSEDGMFILEYKVG